MSGRLVGAGVGLVPGPGEALSVADVVPGPGGGGAPASRREQQASGRRPAVALQTTWRGEATTMRMNSGNAEPVDCR